MFTRLGNKVSDKLKYLFLAILLATILCAVAWLYFNLSENMSVVDQEPPSGLSQFELGQYYFNQHPESNGVYDLTKARKHYQAALQEDPRGNKYTWYQLGRVDFIEGNFLSAIYKFKKQLEYFSDEVPNVYYMLGLTYGYKAMETNYTEDWKIAEQSFIKFIEFSPTSPWPRVDLAWVYFSQGKYDEMLPLLEEGLTHEPNHPWLLNTYGLALLNTGQRARSHEQFIKALTAAEDLSEEEWGKAYTGNSPHDRDDGLEEFRASIRSNLELAES